MKLVEDAGEFWKWNSVHMAGVVSAAMYTWSELPESMREELIALAPSWVMVPVSVLTFVAMVGARVRAQ